MPAELSAKLAAALGAFTIHSQFLFSFAGEAPIDVRTLPIFENSMGRAPPGAAESGGAERLARAIQLTFYDRCYACRGGSGRPTGDATSNAEFVRRLTEANASRGRWDQGWIVHQLGPNGQVFVRKGERERAAMPGAFISEEVLDLAPQIGESVRLRVPHETLAAQPGYYFAFGETLNELADRFSLLRLYFHCDAEAAALLLGALTQALNAFQVPFQLKTPAAVESYDRTDAAVLYIGARYFTITTRIVAQVREQVPLKPAVPLFTKLLWPGIGAAVEPGGGESFGTHRCRLVAEGVVDALQRGSQDVSARLVAIGARFAAAGLDLAIPYLGPDGVDPFDLPLAAKLP